MTILPHINRMKFGIIDQDYMNSLAASTSQFDDIKGGLKKLLHEDPRRGTNSFLAQITEVVEQVSSGDFVIVWRYKWARVDFADLRFFATPSDVSTEINYINPITEVNDKPLMGSKQL